MQLNKKEKEYCAALLRRAIEYNQLEVGVYTSHDGELGDMTSAASHDIIVMEHDNIVVVTPQSDMKTVNEMHNL